MCSTRSTSSGPETPDAPAIFWVWRGGALFEQNSPWSYSTAHRLYELHGLFTRLSWHTGHKPWTSQHRHGSKTGAGVTCQAVLECSPAQIFLCPQHLKNLGDGHMGVCSSILCTFLCVWNNDEIDLYLLVEEERGERAAWRSSGADSFGVWWAGWTELRVSGTSGLTVASPGHFKWRLPSPSFSPPGQHWRQP